MDRPVPTVAVGTFIENDSVWLFFFTLTAYAPLFEFEGMKLPTTTWLQDQKTVQNLFFKYNNTTGGKSNSRFYLHGACGHEQTSKSASDNTAVGSCQGNTHTTRQISGPASFRRLEATRQGEQLESALKRAGQQSKSERYLAKSWNSCHWRAYRPHMLECHRKNQVDGESHSKSHHWRRECRWPEILSEKTKWSSSSHPRRLPPW